MAKPKKALRSINFNMLVQARKVQVPNEKGMVCNCFRPGERDIFNNFFLSLK